MDLRLPYMKEAKLPLYQDLSHTHMLNILEATLVIIPTWVPTLDYCWLPHLKS